MTPGAWTEITEHSEMTLRTFSRFKSQLAGDENQNNELEEAKTLKESLTLRGNIFQIHEETESFSEN